MKKHVVCFTGRLRKYLTIYIVSLAIRFSCGYEDSLSDFKFSLWKRYFIFVVYKKGSKEKSRWIFGYMYLVTKACFRCLRWNGSVFLYEESEVYSTDQMFFMIRIIDEILLHGEQDLYTYLWSIFAGTNFQNNLNFAIINVLLKYRIYIYTDIIQLYVFFSIHEVCISEKINPLNLIYAGLFWSLYIRNGLNQPILRMFATTWRKQPNLA